MGVFEHAGKGKRAGADLAISRFANAWNPLLTKATS